MNNQLNQAGRLDWPESETAIDNTGHNGEVPEFVTYEIAGKLYRVNRMGGYALEWTGAKWEPSKAVMNSQLLG